MIGASLGNFASGMQAGMQLRKAFTGDAGMLAGIGRSIGSQQPINQISGNRSASLAPTAAVEPTSSSFGSLSAKYESAGKSSTIAYDSTGGWSYGKYQFVGGGKTADGSSMQSFLATLEKTDPEAFAKLSSAGGFGGARSGSQAFKSAWKEMSSRPGFQEAEAQNARTTLFTPAANAVKARTGLDVSQRSPAVQEVLFSTAIQHGPSGSGSLWKNALAGLDPSTLSDEELIGRLYDERSKVGRYFKSSTPKIQEAVADRFLAERQDALKLLGASPEQPRQPLPRGIPAYAGEPEQPQQWGLLSQFMNASET